MLHGHDGLSQCAIGSETQARECSQGQHREPDLVAFCPAPLVLELASSEAHQALVAVNACRDLYLVRLASIVVTTVARVSRWASTPMTPSMDSVNMFA